MPLCVLKLAVDLSLISSLCFVLIAFVIIPRLSHLSTIGNFCRALLLCVTFNLFNKIALYRSNNLVSLLSAILFVRDGFCMKLA